MKVAIGQAGGPTAVVNRSLAAFISNFNPGEIMLVFNGYSGLAEDDLIVMKEADKERIISHSHVPGAMLGSGRYHFNEERMERAVNNLKKHDIDTLVFIGGNGTMAALYRISKFAKAKGMDLNVVGIPKTVDNDLCGTDHAPGFASAARYVAMSVRDSDRDVSSMKNFEQVRILETMGRNAGWLALASGYLKNTAEEGPHHIYLPERNYCLNDVLINVERTWKEYGYATVVVSEGVKFDEDHQVQHSVSNGRTVLGGISRSLEVFLQENLGVMARGELLGMNQRSFTSAVSRSDCVEAEDVGIYAAKLVRSGVSGEMVRLLRKDTVEYEVDISSVSLLDVYNGGERLLTSQFIDHPDRYYRWLDGLIGDDLKTYPEPWLRSSKYEEKRKYHNRQ
ncbi:hypothetical protein CR194_13190 [Salipaludibacillus keqinensis]|uniref:Phosphofructokinase domain-containing protein n=1 Tax=Salipaludibacillus keqinensis TaxID=2045207 RepID=A0A323TCT5_9BACI|nr:diphosphate--fructose-6-phosphate 1-phosphotransferase [Salipaludibacillus keqinensis]PYZ92620.1 hypothetical protein CR194_13190 [Salipaludibacillus keqinensis]